MLVYYCRKPNGRHSIHMTPTSIGTLGKGACILERKKVTKRWLRNLIERAEYLIANDDRIKLIRKLASKQAQVTKKLIREKKALNLTDIYL